MFGPNKAAAAVFFEPHLVWTASPTDTQARGQLVTSGLQITWTTSHVDQELWATCGSNTLIEK